MGAPIHAGDLRHRVTVRARIEVPDGRGGFAKATVVVCRRSPAYVEPLSGHTLAWAQQIDPRSRYGVEMRWRQDVGARQELIYHARGGDRIFEVLAVTDTDELHHEMVLLCAEAA